MMGQNDAIRGLTRKDRVSRGARGCLEAAPIRCDNDALDAERDVEGCALLGTKSRPVPCVRTQAMIDMQGAEPKAEVAADIRQQMQQDDGIKPAGKPETEVLVARDARREE